MAAFDGQSVKVGDQVEVDGMWGRVQAVAVEPTTMEPNGYYIVNGKTVHYSDLASCESGWTGDRCTFPLFHEGPHSN